MTRPYTAMMVIPTGIGARVGGFAGDALPVVRTLASMVDRVITHPNVLNGASLFWPLPNTLYVEGYGLDQFCQDRWCLRPVRLNHVGVLLDAAVEAVLAQRQVHVIHAAQATLGLTMTPWCITPRPLGVALDVAPSGSSVGTLKDPDALLEGCRILLDQGAEAIAIVARFPDDLDFSLYNQGEGVDPLAGVEAIISHLVVREFGIPAAHAPALACGAPEPVHPRAAAEEVGFTFLPSVLAGLSYAPQFITSSQPGLPHDIAAADVDVVITPASALGGPGILHLASRLCPPLIIAVAENTTVMTVTAEDVGIPARTVDSYLEALGLVAAHRAGVSLNALQGLY